MGSNVTFYSLDIGDESRHQRICLAAASFSRKMDNWTLLSAGFDVEVRRLMEVQGQLQRHGRVGAEEGGADAWDRLGGRGEWECERMQEKGARTE